MIKRTLTTTKLHILKHYPHNSLCNKAFFNIQKERKRERKQMPPSFGTLWPKKLLRICLIRGGATGSFPYLTRKAVKFDFEEKVKRLDKQTHNRGFSWVQVRKIQFLWRNKFHPGCRKENIRELFNVNYHCSAQNTAVAPEPLGKWTSGAPSALTKMARK